jgi:[ribosomal protein S5]-alanine N-acetyltransferase
LITTARLSLRPPTLADAEAIFTRYASDPAVVRYMAWPRHETLTHTQAFLQFSAAEWERSAAGPYLIESREDGLLLGSTGLAFETPELSSTGYVLARDAWGKGYATEALHAMVSLARGLGVKEIYALCHPEHQASAHVLRKGGFQLEAARSPLATFPNLHRGQAERCLYYAQAIV